nr:alpha/beta hydrolase fold domain-containing protein [Micromonospora sp. CB01531]
MDYRLAPEHLYPAAINAVVDVLRWARPARRWQRPRPGQRQLREPSRSRTNGPVPLPEKSTGRTVARGTTPRASPSASCPSVPTSCPYAPESARSSAPASATRRCSGMSATTPYVRIATPPVDRRSPASGEPRPHGAAHRHTNPSSGWRGQREWRAPRALWLW